MNTTHAHITRHATDPQVVRDVVEGLLFSLTFSAAFAADLSTQMQDHLSIVGTSAATTVLIALIWSVGRSLDGRSDTRRSWTEERTDRRVARTASGPRTCPRQETWVQFMLKDEPNQRASAYPTGFLLTSVSACLLGGLLPLIPYLYLWQVSRTTALLVSVLLTVGALGALGVATARVVGLPLRRSAVQSLVVGGALAGIIYVVIVIMRLIATT